MKYIEECVKAQKICTDNANVPYFVPGTSCPKCGISIFSENETNGYTLKEAKTIVITGCKNCKKSFVE